MIGINMGNNMGIKKKASRKKFKLTEKFIKSAPIGYHNDGDGLYLRVISDTGKMWTLRMVMMGGKRRDMGLGGWPTISLKLARDRSRIYRIIAKDGGNPFQERDKLKNYSLNFKKVSEEYFDENKYKWNNIQHKKQWIVSIQKYMYPYLGNKSLDSIKSTDIINCLKTLWIEKNLTAKRILNRAITIMKWGHNKGYRNYAFDDEIKEIKKYFSFEVKKNSEINKSMPYKSLPNFLIKLKILDVFEVSKYALEFLILTASKSADVLDSKWLQIDFKERIWEIKNFKNIDNNNFHVPLSYRAMQILNYQKKKHSNANDYIFTLPDGKKIPTNYLTLILKKMKLPYTINGFRNTFSDWCSEKTSINRKISENALGIKTNRISELQIHNVNYFSKRKLLMEQWDMYIYVKSSKLKKG